MQARFYLPQFGRFSAPDPARDQHFEDTQSWNIYSYVRNSPIGHTDPTGMVLDDKDKASPSKPRSASESMEADGGNPGFAAPAKQEPSAPTGGTTKSWDPSQPLPKDPSGLGPDWEHNKEHQNPNGEQWDNKGTGEKLDFDKAQKGKPGEKAEDHWHHTPKGEKKGKKHYKPGDVIAPDESASKSEAKYPGQKGWDFHRTPAGMLIDWLINAPKPVPGSRPDMPPLPPLIPLPIPIPIIP